MHNRCLSIRREIRTLPNEARQRLTPAGEYLLAESATAKSDYCPVGQYGWHCACYYGGKACCDCKADGSAKQ